MDEIDVKVQTIQKVTNFRKRTVSHCWRHSVPFGLTCQSNERRDFNVYMRHLLTQIIYDIVISLCFQQRGK